MGRLVICVALDLRWWLGPSHFYLWLLGAFPGLLLGELGSGRLPVSVRLRRSGTILLPSFGQPAPLMLGSQKLS